jgi:hypothetical protein
MNGMRPSLDRGALPPLCWLKKQKPQESAAVHKSQNIHFKLDA